MRTPLMTLSVLALVAIASSALAAPGEYKLTSAIALGSPERWDYVVFDGSSGRVYVAHGTGVSVVDPQKGTVLGTIEPLAGGTHGIGISTATGTGYTDDGKAGVAVPFNLDSFKLAAPIPTAPDADGIVFDPMSKHMFVLNGDNGTVSVIDPSSNAVLATINGGGGLEAGVMDGAGKFYVDGTEHGELIRIDTATNAVDAHWPLTGCVKPHGIAIDTQARRVFATCANQVMVIADADTGKNLATLPIGAYNDGAAFDPVRKLAFSSNGDGTVTIVQEKDANTFVSLATLKTALSARTMDIDPKTGRLFLAAADIAKIDPPTTPGGRPHVEFVPGSLKLMIFDPLP